MNDLGAVFKALLVTDVHVGIDTSQATVKLKEPSNVGGPGLAEVTIYGLPQDTFVFTLDIRGRVLSPFLNADFKGPLKACDGIMVTKVDGKGYILLMELKSGNPKGHTKQLRSAGCFVDYLTSLADAFHEVETRGYQRRHILFHQPKALPSSRQTIVRDKVNGLEITKSTKTNLHLRELLFL